MLRKLLYAGLLCLLGIALGGIILESALRTGLLPNRHYERRRLAGKTQQPRHKLLVLGDSFIVKGTLLHDLLARDLGAHDVAILNAALSGTGPFEYVAEMQTVGARFAPHVVLLSYYAGNDLTNVQHNKQFTVAEKGYTGKGIGINTSASLPLLRHLYVYHFLLRRAQLLKATFFSYKTARQQNVPETLVQEARNFQINPWLVKLAMHEKEFLLDNLLMEKDISMMAWETSKTLLGQLQAICQHLQAQLVIVIFPHTLQVNGSHVDFFKQLAFNFDERVLTSTRPQQLLLDFCAARSIPCLDLLPAFKARQHEELYRKHDDHLHDRGNRLAAPLIVDFLLRTTMVGS